MKLIILSLAILSFKQVFASEDCTQYEAVSFKEVKRDVGGQKNYPLNEAVVDGLTHWAGDVELVVKDKKGNVVCKPPVTGIVWPKNEKSKVVFKSRCGNGFIYESYDGSEHWNTLIDLKSCKKIWEVYYYFKQEDVKFTKVLEEKVNLLSKDEWKVYQPLITKYSKDKNLSVK